MATPTSDERTLWWLEHLVEVEYIESTPTPTETTTATSTETEEDYDEYQYQERVCRHEEYTPTFDPNIDEQGFLHELGR